MSIPTDRLRELANGATIYGYERNEIATELLACREERDAARAEAEKLRSRLRETNQTIVECIGASGPDTSEDAAKRAVDEIENLRTELAAVKRQRDELREWCSQQRAEWLVGARTDPAKAVRTGCAAVACAFSEVLEKLDALAAEQPKPQQPEGGA